MKSTERSGRTTYENHGNSCVPAAGWCGAFGAGGDGLHGGRPECATRSGRHRRASRARSRRRRKPAHCDVHGTVATHGEGAPDGMATFAMQLPQAWQQRFFSMGIGGNGGRLVPAVNATDHAAALGKGYAVIVTDTGHTGNGTDASWVLTQDGKRDQAKVIDFFYRAEHDVSVAGKQFTQAYYASPVQHAYFDGCSNGGRMAMMEADHYPSDYDGIIAGDPGMDYNSAMLRFAVQKVALSSPTPSTAADAGCNRQDGDRALRRDRRRNGWLGAEPLAMPGPC